MSSEEFFKSIELQYQKGFPFVAYRKPNTTLLKALIQNDETLHVTRNYIESGFVFAPFDDQNPSILIPLLIWGWLLKVGLRCKVW